MWKPLHRQGQGGALIFQKSVEQQVHRRQSRENPVQSVPSSTSQPETLVCMPTAEPDTFVEILEVTLRRQIGWSSLSSKDTESLGHRKIFLQLLSLSMYIFLSFFSFLILFYDYSFLLIISFVILLLLPFSMLLFLNIYILYFFFLISTGLFHYLTFSPCFRLCIVVSLLFSVCFHLWACLLVLFLSSFWFLFYFSCFLFSLHFVSVSV